MSRTGERVRFWIADQLNRLPSRCWSDLVNWAIFWPEYGRLPSPGSTEHCRQTDANRVGSCYCNKIQAEAWAAVVLDAHQHAGWDRPRAPDTNVICRCGWIGKDYRGHVEQWLAAADPHHITAAAPTAETGA